MSKRMKIMIIALSLLFGGIILFHLVKSFMIKRFFAHYEAPAVTVSSVTAIKKNWEPKISAVGNFVAINGVEVNSEASGNVTKIHFDSGQYIEAGSPLIDIDDQIDQAQLKFNQADMKLKDINYERQTNLFKRNATPSSTVDEAKASLDQAKANVEKIEAQIKQKHITAPFSGQVGIRQVNLGQYISPGQTSVVTLQSLDPLYVEFNLPEQYFKQIHIGQKVEFTIDEFDNMVFEGKISAINPKADVNTHNFLIQASLPNCPSKALKEPTTAPGISVKKQLNSNKLVISCASETNKTNKVDTFSFIPGMFTSIAVEQPPIPDVVMLPSTSISYSLYGNSVYKIEKEAKAADDKTSEDTYRVNRVFVSTGEQAGNFTVIKKGVNPGDIVVSSGELKLQNGARVVINNAIKLNDVSDPTTIGQ